VPARTSSFYFKGKSEDIQTIARRLMVAHILEGSVRKSGARMRIAARLVRADNGYVAWTETYDRPVDDLLWVQDDIAGEVGLEPPVEVLERGTLDADPGAAETGNPWTSGKIDN